MPEGRTSPAALWQYDARLAMNALQKQPDGSGLDFPGPRDSMAAVGSASVPWLEELNTLVRSHIRTRSSIPLPISPIRPDTRMTAQQTILTVDARLEGGISYPLRTQANIPLIFKVNLPGAWRREVLRTLALMGITAASLFPARLGLLTRLASFRTVSVTSVAKSRVTSVACWKLFYSELSGTMEHVSCSCSCPAPG